LVIAATEIQLENELFEGVFEGNIYAVDQGLWACAAFYAHHAGVAEADTEGFGDGTTELIAADGDVSGEEKLRSAGDHGARAAASDVNVEAGGFDLAGAAIDACEAVEQCEGLDVHADDVEVGGSRGIEIFVDPSRIGGHDDGVIARRIVGEFLRFSDDPVTDEGVCDVEGKAAACFADEGGFQVFSISRGKFQILYVDNGSGEPEHNLATAERRLFEQLRDSTREKRKMHMGIGTNIRRNFGAGGGMEREIPASPLDLGDAQGIRAEVHSHGVSRREDLAKAI
jgi:hypothetical protein